MVRPSIRLAQSLRPRRLPQNVSRSHRQTRFASSTPGGNSTEAAQKKAEEALATAQKYAGQAVDAGKKLAYVDGGSIWKTVDKATIKHGMVTVAGTVNHVSTLFCLSQEARSDTFLPLRLALEGTYLLIGVGSLRERC